MHWPASGRRGRLNRDLANPGKLVAFHSEHRLLLSTVTDDPTDRATDDDAAVCGDGDASDECHPQQSMLWYYLSIIDHRPIESHFAKCLHLVEEDDVLGSSNVCDNCVDLLIDTSIESSFNLL